MHCNIFLRPTDLNVLKKGDVVGVDRGAYFLTQTGTIPTKIFGDFDSVSKRERERIEAVIDVDAVPSEKDVSDFELALQSLIDTYQSIDVYGALGGRIDHELANIYLIAHSDYVNTHIRLIDAQNIIEILPKGTHTVHQYDEKKYISFLPIQNTTLTLNGFKYDIEARRITVGKTLTISNEFKESVGNVSTNEPIIMIQSND